MQAPSPIGQPVCSRFPHQAGAGEAAIDDLRSVLQHPELALHGAGDLAEVGGGEVAEGALARKRHFARAAQASYVSRPSLPEGIRKLEEEFCVALVHRGRACGGLTPEGERVVAWVRRILADRDAMKDEVRALRSGLSGTLRIGSVLPASAVVSLLTSPFCAENPQATAAEPAQEAAATRRKLHC